METISIRVTSEARAAWDKAREAMGDDATAGDLFTDVMNVYAEGSLKRDHPERASTLEAYDACVNRLRAILVGAMAEADVRQDETTRELKAERDRAVEARQEAERALEQERERVRRWQGRVAELEAEVTALRAQGELYERLREMIGMDASEGDGDVAGGC
jgi:chromosome segregation ATPase